MIDKNLSRAYLEKLARDDGIHFGDDVVGFTEEGSMKSLNYAMDAQPQLATVSSSGVPAFLTTSISPKIIKIFQAKNTATENLGEERFGSFEQTTQLFSVVEHTGQTAAYGDHNNDGNANSNAVFPSRQNFIWQTVAKWGQLAMDRMGLAKINWAEQVRGAAIDTHLKFFNYMYHYGIQGLANYGILNSPGLLPAISPAPKVANNGFAGPWMTSATVTASTLEIYRDIQALILQGIVQSNGNADVDSKMTIIMSPQRKGALTTPNDFGLNIPKLIADNYKNATIKTSVLYGAYSLQNTQGSQAGEIMQVVFEDLMGQQTGVCGYSEKLRSGPVILGLSEYTQKMSAGGWGYICYQPFAVATMLGI